MTTTAPPATSRKSLEPYLKDDVEYYPHQVDGIRKLARQSSFLLADDMGLGKSLQALTIFAIDAKMGKAETLLIVCPVSLRENWADEIEKFTRIPYVRLGEEPNPYRHGQFRKMARVAQRQEQLVEFLHGGGARILIANYEQLVSTLHSATFGKYKFDTVIFDEAHFIKNPDAKRTKASHRVISSRSFLLTGTPMLNQVDELWSLLHRINPTKYPKYWTFVSRYCVFGGFNNKQVVGTKNEAELIRALSDVMLRRKKEDVLTLPQPYYFPVVVGLSETQRRLYDEVVDDLRLGGNDITNGMVKFLRLKQICGTPYAIDPSLPDDSMKLDRAVEIINDVSSRGEKIVVFTQFRGVLEALCKRLTGYPVFQLHGDIPTRDRVPTIKAWSSTQGSAVIACMIQVAGVGLNMTAAKTALFLDKLFVPGLNRQAVDRIHRIGQDQSQPVQIFEMMCKGTVEHRVELILKIKSKLFGEIVEGGVGMRKLMEELMKEMVSDMS